MAIELQNVQSTYDKQLQKVQYAYDNTTAKSIIQVWQYNCKKYNIRMPIQLQKVQYPYDNTTAKSTIHL